MGLFIHISYLEHRAGIAVNTVVVRRDIDIDNVPVFEGTIIRDTVADYFINRGAQGLGESHVTQT